MIKCPKCGEENRDYDRYCLSCGESLKKQVEYKKQLKEYEKLKQKEQEQKTKKEEENTNLKSHRDYNRRYTRETSKNIKTINQRNITKNTLKKGTENKFKGFFKKEFRPIPLILSIFIPGLGFIYYHKWKKAIFTLLITILFIIYILPFKYGNILYAIYWLFVLFLTNNES